MNRRAGGGGGGGGRRRTEEGKGGQGGRGVASKVEGTRASGEVDRGASLAAEQARKQAEEAEDREACRGATLSCSASLVELNKRKSRADDDITEPVARRCTFVAVSDQRVVLHLARVR